jgi:hypothetical protein
MAPRKPKVEKPTTAEVKSEVASKRPSTPQPAPQEPGSQNTGPTSPRGQKKPKRKQGGKGKPFVKGQKDLPGKRFEKGKSANPGGRPKELRELKEMIRNRGADLIDILFAIADEEPEMVPSGKDGQDIVMVGPTHGNRIAAVERLLAYGYGKPAQPLTGENGGPVKLTYDDVRAKLQAMAQAAAAVVASQTPPADAPNGSGSNDPGAAPAGG